MLFVSRHFYAGKKRVLYSDRGSPPRESSPHHVSNRNGNTNGRGHDNGTSRVNGNLSPSSPSGHRRTHTDRIRELLSRVDGLVDDVAEDPDEQESLNAGADLPPLSPSGLTLRASGSGGGGGDTSSIRSGTRSHRSGVTMESSGARVSLGDLRPTSSSRNGSETSSQLPEDPEQRTFFADESEAHPCSDPFTLAEGRFHPPVLPKETTKETRLLSEVDWLIAGTMAALGDEAEELGASLTPDKNGEHGASPEVAGTSERVDMDGESVPERDASPGRREVMKDSSSQAPTAVVTDQEDGGERGSEEEVGGLPSPPERKMIMEAAKEEIVYSGQMEKVGELKIGVKLAPPEVDVTEDISTGGVCFQD